MARICIICGKEMDGTPVKMDAILCTIRRIKQALRISTGHELVVCGGCLPENKKRREKFERAALTLGGLGAVIGIILIIFNILQGFDLFRFLSALALFVFLVVIFLLVALFQYHPALEVSPAAAPAAVPAPPLLPSPPPPVKRPKKPMRKRRRK